jgi:BirA family transcriptional regulator, biotin operon repressor / biotin---[acetyl-CoA-carboxylase] ligase
MNKELTTLFTGRKLISLQSVDSTNSYLSDAMRLQTLPEGAAVKSVSQKSGRGQAGARWSSDEGKNLLVSFVFYPSFLAPKQIYDLNKTYALGVYDLIRNFFGEEAKIKWPNDIYYREKKLGGLLVENSLTSTAVTSSIVGIGLNINQKEFPQNIPNPTSLALIKPGIYDVDEVFYSLCSSIEQRYLQLKQNGVAEIEKEYGCALYRRDEWSWYEDKKGKFPGAIKGVDNHGRLLIEDEDGDIRVYDLKEIKFVH